MKVGNFEITGAGSDFLVKGPRDYMKEQGEARLDTILAGKDHVTNFGIAQSGNILQSVLVSLQTDYAAWLGQKQFARSLKQ